MLKRYFAIIISLVLTCGINIPQAVSAEEELPYVGIADLQIGDYIQFGKYDEKPVIWRYGVDDDNGKLIASDKVLCRKWYDGSASSDNNRSLWKNSFIREWLNSDISADEADWSWSLDMDPWHIEYNNVDIHEKGFLHDDNFSIAEKKVIKSVSQWTMLPYSKADLSENGNYDIYNPIKRTETSGHNTPIRFLYQIVELPEHYHGAAQTTIDRMFLMDEMQIYKVSKNIEGFLIVLSPDDPDVTQSYFLRTAYDDVAHYYIGNVSRSYHYTSEECGIRPAFYIDEENTVILSGKGTKEEPYVVSGEPDLSVSLNSREIDFDQSPVEHNRTAYIPVRRVMEEMGAEVDWDDRQRKVIIKKESDIIEVSVDMHEMYINGEMLWLKEPVILKGERTLVPLEVLTEGFSISAEYDSNLHRITINS